MQQVNGATRVYRASKDGPLEDYIRGKSRQNSSALLRGSGAFIKLKEQRLLMRDITSIRIAVNGVNLPEIYWWDGGYKLRKSMPYDYPDNPNSQPDKICDAREVLSPRGVIWTVQGLKPYSPNRR